MFLSPDDLFIVVGGGDGNFFAFLAETIEQKPNS